MAQVNETGRWGYWGQLPNRSDDFCQWSPSAGSPNNRRETYNRVALDRFRGEEGPPIHVNFTTLPQTGLPGPYNVSFVLDRTSSRHNLSVACWAVPDSGQSLDEAEFDWVVGRYPLNETFTPRHQDLNFINLTDPTYGIASGDSFKFWLYQANPPNRSYFPVWESSNITLCDNDKCLNAPPPTSGAPHPAPPSSLVSALVLALLALLTIG